MEVSAAIAANEAETKVGEKHPWVACFVIREPFKGINRVLYTLSPYAIKLNRLKCSAVRQLLTNFRSVQFGQNFTGHSFMISQL